MDSFKQVRDIFDLSQHVHRQLSAFYARLADQAQRQRVKLLLDYLSRHEANLQECLKRYENDVSNALLDAWVQYVPEALPFAVLQTPLARPDMSVDEVVAVALQLDEALVEFYTELAENAEAREMREMFGCLRQMAVSEEVALKRESGAF